jgi:nitrogenase molybdenum-iron protein alpha/beta subunit
MATVVASRKPVTVDPLRHSGPLGAVLAFLGVARCMPLLHSSQGCAAFVKVLLTRHFRESIPLQTSALTEVTTILGSGDSLLSAIATVIERQQPEVIGVVTTGLVDAAGEDVRRTLRLRSSGPPVVLAAVSDLGGGLQQGYAAAVEALVAELALPRAGAAVDG